MNEIKVFPIGKIENEERNVGILLDPQYRKGLKGLGAFSHIQILWWANKCDNPRDRKTLVEEKPYRKGPEELGVFALRSPERPNPMALSIASVSFVDEESGRVGLYYVDAFSGSPVIDIKPYVPSLDRLERPQMPSWCSHWPKSYEESGSFDWEAEFNFWEERCR